MASKKKPGRTKQQIAAEVGKRIEHKKKRFLEYYNKTRNVRKACEAIGVAHTTIYAWKRNDKEFERDFFEAKEAWVDDLESSLQNLAVNGEKTPIIIRGEGKEQKVGWYQKIVPSISIFMLKYNRKSKYLPEYAMMDGNPDDIAKEIRDSLREMQESIPGVDE